MFKAVARYKNTIGLVLILIVALLPIPMGGDTGMAITYGRLLLVFGLSAAMTWQASGAQRYFLIALEAAVAIAAAVVIRPYFAPADISVRLINPALPRIELTNLSKGQAAHKIDYVIALWNLDAADRYQPGRTFSSIKELLNPGETLGPYELFDASTPPGLPNGTHLFGYISANCNECERTRSYWVYVTVGSGGWYAETAERSEDGPLSPNYQQEQTAVDYSNSRLKNIREGRRISIK